MNIVVRNSDNVIVMFSSGLPEPGEGNRLIELNDAQWAEYEAVSAVRNGGVTFDGTSFVALPPPPPPPPPTAQDKLAAAGLSVDELKQLLGLA